MRRSFPIALALAAFTVVGVCGTASAVMNNPNPSTPAPKAVIKTKPKPHGSPDNVNVTGCYKVKRNSGGTYNSIDSTELIHDPGEFEARRSIRPSSSRSTETRH